MALVVMELLREGGIGDEERRQPLSSSRAAAGSGWGRLTVGSGGTCRRGDGARRLVDCDEDACVA